MVLANRDAVQLGGLQQLEMLDALKDTSFDHILCLIGEFFVVATGCSIDADR